MKKKLGEPIVCCVCLETVTRTGPNQVQCNHPCEPHPDAEIKCTVCGEDKHPSEFYDYRYNIDGKLVHRCKICVCAANKISQAKRKNK